MAVWVDVLVVPSGRVTVIGAMVGTMLRSAGMSLRDIKWPVVVGVCRVRKTFRQRSVYKLGDEGPLTASRYPPVSTVYRK